MTTAAEKKTEDWMTSKWRPLMAITYMATIWFDFIVGPILFNILQYLNPGQAVSSWTPLTLQGGGLYHLSMGAILGIAAWTRGKEKVAAIENGKDESKGFNQGWGTAPEVNVPQQPQWITPPVAQGVKVEQTWTQSEPVETSYSDPGFGAVPPANNFNQTSWDQPAEGVTNVTPAADDPNRPKRRKKI